jgi:hypothetical protein
MNKAIEQIDPDKDTHMVVENLGSGYAPPEDDAFIDLGKCFLRKNLKSFHI